MKTGWSKKAKKEYVHRMPREVYEQLLDAYPDYEKNDLVLYQLSRAYETAGERDLALATLDKLVTEFPSTPHFNEAHFRRGETLFIEGRYGEAEEAYERVLGGGPEAAFGEQSLYKLGWALFKQLRHEESLEPFFGLLDRKFVTGSADDPIDPGADADRVHALLRKPNYIPESMSVLSVIQLMRRERFQLAVVMDEHGGIEGIVTIKDLMSELVGELQDEYDPGAPSVVNLAPRTWMESHTPMPSKMRREP